MILSALGRTALKWALYALAFILLLAALNWGLSYVPFTAQWNGKRAVARVEAMKGQIDSLERAATGQAEIQTATDTYHQSTTVIREVTAAAISDARSDPDAETPIDPVRAGRFDAHYHGVCDATPAACPAPDAP